MGQVYRATDTALGRQVAIKILPDTFASDPDRLARFEREARTLASLNHLHIATIYAVERSAGLHALVMELVEGEDLSQRIDRGAIPVEDALPIAKQIAEALEAAHEQGIIHRDLKPANIKVRPDGMVKVLDFGLAKLTGPTGSQSADVADSPTITSPAMTAQGMILGTAAYMAPEQARGKVIDKRVDVWAFGCILFEMLTGTRPFGGDNVTETLANVLKSAPDWKALPGDVPVIVRHLIQRCLEKDATRRLAATAAITYVLDEAVTAVHADPHAVTSVQAKAAPLRWYFATAALVVLLATVVAITVWRTRPPTEPLVVTRFPIASFEGPISVGRNRIAVSRDGTRLVYYVNGRPLLRDTSQFAAKPIPSSFTGQTVFSPDGRTLAAWSADNTIKRVDIGGGAVETVCPADNVFGMMTWDTDALIVGQGPNGIVRCRLSGGAPQQIVKLEAGEEADGPQMLPGGGAVLFTLARTEDGAARWDNARIVIQSLTSNERSLVLERANSGQYLATGHLVYARGGVVFAVPFDVQRKQVIGQGTAVIEGVRRAPGSATAGAQFAISNNGHLFYIPGPAGTGVPDRSIAIADRVGRVTRLPIPPGAYVHTRVSRDGKWLAVGTDDGKDAAVWTYAIGGSGVLQKLALEGHNRYPIWSPDGTRLAFQSDRGGDLGIFVQRADGTGRVERLTTAPSGQSHVPDSWSPDGQSMMVSVAEGPKNSLSVLSLANRSLSPFGGADERAKDAVFSPDGKWVAYSAGSLSGLLATSRGVFVRPFPAADALYQAPRVVIDFHPTWTSGNELIYVTAAASGQFASVKVGTARGVDFSTPETLPARVTGSRINSQSRAYNIMPDGRFIGVIDATEQNDSRGGTETDVRVVFNWFEELKRLVPTK